MRNCETPGKYDDPTIFYSLLKMKIVQFLQNLTDPRLTVGCVAGASTDNLPPGVLYKVKATYKYQAEDMDELAFEVGEMIQVVEYDDPEEQVN